jgi:type IV pilus assembly protein PilE
MKSRAGGVTLVELLVVVTILGIVAAVAIPSYRAYVVRANRSDAKSATLAMASQLERCFTRYNAYDDANCPVTITNVPSPEGHYLLNAEVAASTFTVTATPQGEQAQDPCGSFSLNSSDVRAVGGTESVADCWKR